jgi:hypothetical protein
MLMRPLNAMVYSLMAVLIKTQVFRGIWGAQECGVALRVGFRQSKQSKGSLLSGSRSRAPLRSARGLVEHVTQLNSDMAITTFEGQ